MLLACALIRLLASHAATFPRPGEGFRLGELSGKKELLHPVGTAVLAYNNILSGGSVHFFAEELHLFADELHQLIELVGG